MPNASAILQIKILADAKQAQAGLDKSAGAVDKWSGRLNTAALAVGVGIAAIGKPAVDAASRLEQAFGGAEAVFGRYADTVKARSRDSADAIGLSSAAYAEAATSIGGNLKRMGVPMSQVADQSDVLIQRAADLAATYGGTTAEAVDALGAAFRGEADPAEKFNLNLKDSQVKAEMAAQAASGLKFATQEQARASAISALILKQSADAAGQFARESNSAAGAQQRATAAAEDAKAALGQALLPVVVILGNALSTLSGLITKNEAVTRRIVVAVVAFAGAVLTANVALRVYRAVTTAASTATTIYRTVTTNARVAMALLRSSTLASTAATVKNRVATIASTAAQKAAAIASKAWAVAQRVLNAVLRANPIGIVITLIFALGAALVLAYRKSETFRRIVNSAFAGVKAAIRSLAAVAGAIGRAFASAFAVVRSAANAALGPIRWLISAVRQLIAWISRIHFPKMPSFGGLFGRSAPSAAMAPANITTASRTALAGPVGPVGARSRVTGGALTVNVSGAVNPQALARDLDRLLNGARVRTGWQGVR